MDLKRFAHFLCPLDEKVLVLLLDRRVDRFEMPPDSKWHFDMGMFETSHAFAVWEDVPQPLILIDKDIFQQEWFSADHLFVILAHEIAHIHLKSLDEDLCDGYAMGILRKHGLTTAAQFLEVLANRRS